MCEEKVMVIFQKIVDLALLGEWTCTDCHVSNLSDLLLKFWHEILWYVLFPIELMALNLDFSILIYGMFTKNTCLRPVWILVNKPNFHKLYLWKYRKTRTKNLTTCTSMCLLTLPNKIIFQTIPKKGYN